jgi:environmental stress-induced protein Ves
MRILRADSYRSMPWKNGGGETTEIAVWPENASLDDFGWRVSMARVDRSGPFSMFPGVDRTLSILEGEGLRLAVEGHAAVDLTGAVEPYAFPADEPTESNLIGAAVTDLNVMTRRGKFTHTTRRIAVSGKMEIASDAGVAILLCHRGSVEVKTGGISDDLGPLDCAILESPKVSVAVRAGQAASFYTIEIMKAV